MVNCLLGEVVPVSQPGAWIVAEHSNNYQRWVPAIVAGILIAIIVTLLMGAKARTAQSAEVSKDPYVCGIVKEYSFQTNGGVPWEMSFTFLPYSVVKMRSMIEVNLKPMHRYKIFYRDTVIANENRRYFQGFTPVKTCVDPPHMSRA